jgi:hypothetical protein
VSVTLPAKMVSVRRLLFLLFALILPFEAVFCNSTQVFYNSPGKNAFQIFEENGKVGVKNDQGQIVIPAQHEAIGWSNGDFSILENVTGYRNQGMWGLINLQNNKITKPEFIDLSPGDATLIVARKKLPGLVKIQTGCISTSGKEIIPFVYDGLRVLSLRAIVYVRNGIQFKHGLIDLNNKVLIPLQYRNIYTLGSLRFGVENFQGKTAIFSENGNQMIDFLIDSLSSFKKDYAIIYQNQRQGLIDRSGQIKLQATYQEIKINEDGSVMARPGNLWLFLDGENKLVKQFQADSITIIDENLIKVQNGNAIQLANKDFDALSPTTYTYLGEFNNNRAIFRQGHDIGMIDKSGKVLIQPLYQNLIADENFIRATQRIENNTRWVVLNSEGNKTIGKQYDYIGKFNGKYFPVRNRGFWGGMDGAGKEIIACAHDSIVQHKGKFTVVKFKGQYGMINLREEWIVIPQPNKIEILTDDRYFLISPKTKFFKSLKGEIIYFSDNRLEFNDDHLTEYLPSGNIWQIDLNGLISERLIPPAGVEKIALESEGLRAIRKDDRYGFVDSRGRLRIANRYEDARDFSENLAAIKIRGKWGFINHEDAIAIQPVYDAVSQFKSGVAMVKQKNQSGLVNNKGKLVLPVRYDSIVVLKANRFLILQNNLWGLVDGSGTMIINPKFDKLEDLDNGYIIVSRNGKFGLLTTQGLSTIPEMYDGLTFDKIHGHYLAVKKAEWQTISLEK